MPGNESTQTHQTSSQAVESPLVACMHTCTRLVLGTKLEVNVRKSSWKRRSPDPNVLRNWCGARLEG